MEHHLVLSFPFACSYNPEPQSNGVQLVQTANGRLLSDVGQAGCCRTCLLVFSVAPSTIKIMSGGGQAGYLH